MNKKNWILLVCYLVMWVACVAIYATDGPTIDRDMSLAGSPFWSFISSLGNPAVAAYVNAIFCVLLLVSTWLLMRFLNNKFTRIAGVLGCCVGTAIGSLTGVFPMKDNDIPTSIMSTRVLEGMLYGGVILSIFAIILALIMLYSTRGLLGLWHKYHPDREEPQ